MTSVPPEASIVSILWKIKVATNKAKRSNHRCNRLNVKLDTYMPVFSDATDQLFGRNDKLLHELEAYAVETLEYIKTLSVRPILQDSLFLSYDKERFDRVFSDMDRLQYEITTYLNELKASSNSSSTNDNTEVPSSPSSKNSNEKPVISFYTTKEYRDQKLNDLRNDIIYDKKILMEAKEGLTADEVEAIKKHISLLIESVLADEDTSVLAAELAGIKVEPRAPTTTTSISTDNTTATNLTAVTTPTIDSCTSDETTSAMIETNEANTESAPSEVEISEDQVEFDQKDITQEDQSGLDDLHISLPDPNSVRAVVNEIVPSGTYTGPMKGGLMNGYGSLTYPEDDTHRRKTYEGWFVDGLFNGKGELCWRNGAKYVGDFKNDERDGVGSYYYTNGDRYEGEWKYNKREGKGRYYHENDRYDGDWKENKADGRGVYYYSNGDKYDGEFANDGREGFGVHYYANGSRYEGTYRCDKKYGRGVMYAIDGVISDQEFVEGELILDIVRK